jgi:Gpi18-like mannosyltransferase
MQAKYKFLLILLIGILIRLTFVSIYFNSDVVAQAEWALRLKEDGPKNFYENTQRLIEKPNYPPLMNVWYLLTPTIQENISLIFTNTGSFIAIHRLGANHIPWFYQFIRWFGSDTIHTLEQTSVRYGFLVTVKLLPILADILIGVLVYLFSKKINPKKTLLFSSLYLLFPFSYYVSSYWGQTDPISALLLLIAFLMLHKKRYVVAPILLILSLSIKPTGLLITPLFIFYYFYQKPHIKFVATGLVFSLLTHFILLSFFTNDNLFFYTQKLINIFFFSKQPHLSVSAFNFWYLFEGFSKTLDTKTYLLIPAKTWGYTAILVLNLIAFNLIRQKTIKSVFLSIFIVGFGSWLFLTNMYERYLFNAILALFFLSIIEQKFLKYFFLLSSISLLNMLQGPLAPKIILNLLDNNLFSKLLAVSNILIFFWILYKQKIIELPNKLFRV